MNLRLEELRRRLMEPSPVSGNTGKTVYWRSSLPTYPKRQPGEVVEIGLAPEADRSDGAELISDNVADAVLQYVARAESSPAASAEAPEQGHYQLARAVAKVFDQTRPFEDSFFAMQQMLEPIKQAGDAMARSIEPLKALQGQIRELAKAFDSMRSFQDQIATLAESFEPMKSLEQQVAQFAQAFEIHLRRLNRSLDAAKAFRGELVNVARAFDPLDDLQDRFSQIAEAYQERNSTNSER